MATVHTAEYNTLIWGSNNYCAKLENTQIAPRCSI